MIKIVLSDWPDKHKVKPEDIEDKVTVPPWECYFITEIVHNGINYTGKEDPCWDIEVYLLLGSFRVRLPNLTREGVTTADMLFELMLYQNGEATDWIRVLLGQADVDGIWERYHREVPT